MYRCDGPSRHLHLCIFPLLMVTFIFPDTLTVCIKKIVIIAVCQLANFSNADFSFFLSFPVCIIWLPCGPPFFFIKKNWFHFSFAQRSCLLSCSLLKRNTSRKKGIKGSTVILYPVPFCSYSLSLILPLHIYIQICYYGHLVIWMCVNVTDSLIDSFLQW